MPSFNVLSAEQDVYRNTILEASAGTGKTFSIENLVVRLILEQDLSIERILIVTFTKAATRDLRVRVRKNITRVIEMLRGKSEPFEYVKKHLQSSENMVRRLQRALLIFDNASIETIHGFCFKSLRENIFEGDMPLTTQYEGDQPGKAIYLRIVRDYFRTGLRADDISPAQLERVAASGINKLEMKLLKYADKSIEVASTKPFSQSLSEFQEAFKQLNFQGEKLKLYHEANGRYYKKVVNDLDQWIERFASCTGNEADFEFLIREGIPLAQHYDKENLRKRPKPLPHPELDLLEPIQRILAPIVNEARSCDMIHARMVHSIQKMVNHYLKEEEMWRFDDLLKAMQESIHKPLFNKALRDRFDAVIVDEFQDTDPMQWDIFSSLYVTDDWKGHIYIVGDPKQSIYAFRSADIYTYLQALEEIGEDACATLDVNYRSHPKLIEELNRFFDVDFLFPLPSSKGQLHYKPVQAKEGDHAPLIEDGKGPLHCFIAQDDGKQFSYQRVLKDYFFPYIAQEINTLRKEIPLSQIAVLVRRHAEAEKLALYLRQQKIDAQLMQSMCLSESVAVKGIKDILAAASDPRNLSKARVALAGALLGWNDDELANLVPEEALMLFSELHVLPVLSFLQRVLEEAAENLLTSPEGFKIYEDFIHLMELVVSKQSQAPMTLDGLTDFLNELTLLEFEKDESLKRQSHAEEEAVQILTLHVSKGLEFDVVFALGLTTPSNEPGLFVMDRDKNCIEAIIDREDPRYKRQCEEEDAEKMRLLYVALTRAKRRVYVPYVAGEKAVTKKAGEASCMELYARLNPRFAEDFSSERVNKIVPEPSAKQENFSLIPPPQLVIPWQERYLYSFSSLVRNRRHVQEEFDPPHDFACAEKNIHTLPAGAETGTLLHELLEKLSFDDSNIEEMLDNHLQHSIYKPWRDVLLSMLLQIQKLPQLEGLDSKEIYREVEFLYPTDKGLLKGVIDLVFRKDGRYYLLDWKSNWLGPDNSHYGVEFLNAAMTLHEYELQASIYAEALRRYLGILDEREFEECFGGIYYVFLRGLDSASIDAGVLHFFPKVSPPTMNTA